LSRGRVIMMSEKSVGFWFWRMDGSEGRRGDFWAGRARLIV
jgi:hypothetical protein